MKNNHTLLIIKNHIVAENKQWDVLRDLGQHDINISLVKRMYFDCDFYKRFYGHLSKRTFYLDLCSVYSKGDVYVVYVSGVNIVTRLRDIIGPTNPTNALEGQIRHKYGVTITLNAVHASESYNDYINETRLIRECESK